MASEVRRGGEVVTTRQAGGRTFTTYTPAKSFSTGRKSYAAYKSLKEAGKDVEAEKLAEASLKTDSVTLTAETYAESRQASREYRETLQPTKTPETTTPGVVSVYRGYSTKHVYETKEGKKELYSKPRVVMQASPGFAGKVRELGQEMQRRRAPKQYWGTSGEVYGEVTPTGQILRTPEQVRADPTKYLSSAERISVGGVPERYWGKTSYAYGEVTPKGEQIKEVIWRVRGGVLRTDFLPAGTGRPELHYTPTYLVKKYKELDKLVGSKLIKEDYLQPFLKERTLSEERQRKYESELKTLKVYAKEKYGGVEQLGLKQLPLKLSITGKEMLVGFEKGQQQIIGYQYKGSKYIQEHGLSLGLLFAGAGALGYAGVGAGAGAITTKAAVVKGGLVGLYAGSVTGKYILAPTHFEKGGVLGEETIKLGAIIGGYKTGAYIKSLGHQTLQYAPKKPVKYESYKPVTYDQQKIIQYAPKVRGEVTTPADRTRVIVSRFAPQRFAPSVRETQQRFISHRFADRKLNYYYESLRQHQTGKVIRQTSIWAKYKKDINAFEYMTKKSGFTKPYKLSYEKIKRMNIPSDWAREQTTLNYETIYRRNIASDWAREITPAKKTILYRYTDTARPSKTILKVKKDTRVLGMQPHHSKTYVQSSFQLRINPQKYYSQYSEYSTKNIMETLYRQGRGLINQDYLVTTGEQEFIGGGRLITKGGLITDLGVKQQMFTKVSDVGAGALIAGGLPRGKLKVEQEGIYEVKDKSKIKGLGIIDVGLISKLKVEQEPVVSTIPIISQDQKVGVVGKSKVRQVYDFIYPTTPTIPTPTPPPTPPTTPPSVIEPPPTPPPTPPELFSFGRRTPPTTTKKGKKGRVIKAKTGYLPSFEALIFDIKGIKPPKMEYTTGLTLRPMIR